MGKYFVRGTPLAGLERMMMEVPNFAARSSGTAILCRYHPQAADVDCRNCLQYRRRGCRSLTCLYLAERLQAGAVAMEEMVAELVRPWKHLRLKQRAVGIAGQVRAFYFEGQLHIARMLRMTQGDETVDSRWLAAVYLLSSHASLWQKTLAAVTPGRIAFERVRLDHTMELLENLGIGDTLRQDCRIIELNSKYSVLESLAGSEVNVDELDYLAKRLESFCASEDEQFQAMGHKLGLTDIKDFINLTFCCQESTVISDFSKLEQAGKYHAMNLNGGTLPLEELKALDGREAALRLIDTGTGVVTPYGVVYDNGMKLEPLYQGRQFPPYCYDDSPLTVCLTPTQGGEPAVLDLPVSDRQLGRSLLRAGIANLRDVELSIEIDNLPQKVSNRLHLEREGLDDLNEMCRVIQPLSQAQREMLEAVVCATQPEYAGEVRRLAEELDQFEFIPNVRTAEEFGKYMIRESGHFQYDENLEGFYDYRLYGEQRIREEGGLFTAHGYVAYHGTIPLEELMQDDPAEQYQREQGPQMGGIA